MICWVNLLNNVCQVTAPTAIFKGDADSLTALEDINRLVRCKGPCWVQSNVDIFLPKKISNLLSTFVFVFLIRVVKWTTLFRCQSCQTWCWTILWRLRAGPTWIISVRLRHHMRDMWIFAIISMIINISSYIWCTCLNFVFSVAMQADQVVYKHILNLLSKY